jgi:hypothetical protein
VIARDAAIAVRLFGHSAGDDSVLRFVAEVCHFARVPASCVLARVLRLARRRVCWAQVREKVRYEMCRRSSETFARYRLECSGELLVRR